MDKEEYQRRKELGRKRYLIKLKVEEAKKAEIIAFMKKYRLNYMLNSVCVLSVLLGLLYWYSITAEPFTKAGIITGKSIVEYKYRGWNRWSGKKYTHYEYRYLLKVNRQRIEVSELFYSGINMRDTVLVKVSPVFHDINEVIPATPQPFDNSTKTYDRPSSFYVYGLLIPVLALIITRRNEAYYNIRFGIAAWAAATLFFFLWENGRLLNIFF